ncbi:aminoacyl-tRNA hydrolase [Flindersiella endophytica]
MSDDGGVWLVVGLGNPGPTYAAHRHNVGHMVLDELGGRLRATQQGPRSSPAKIWRSHPRGRAEVVEDRVGALPGTRVVLAKPRSYMNESGGPVASLATFYKLPPKRIVVVHDELDIPYGEVRLKFGGGDNGHNGLRSIRRSIATGDFHRVRFGIGRPPGRQDPADFVLSPFSAAERKELPFFLDRAVDALELLVTEGLERAQNAFHGAP